MAVTFGHNIPISNDRTVPVITPIATHTSGICTAKDSACIWRACSRYA
jgi:hypothetical protein